ncbi:MAG: hypothetical protein H0V12_11930 [Chloroflexi bacterium]|nr:hypothetical protein [Chloroflexota bacterium]
MDNTRSLLLGEIANEAAMERSSFLVEAADQLRGFLDNHADRIRELGGMVLIDEDPDYLSIAPDGTFRSRSRYLDETSGQWVSDTEVIETSAELVELYNPAEVYAAFAEAAREQAGLPDQPTATDDLMEAAGIAPDETVPPEGTGDLAGGAYAEVADDWAATREDVLGEEPADDEAAAQQLYDLALTFQERSQQSEANLIERFELSAARLTQHLGDFIVVDDEDERLTLRQSGSFSAEVVPEEEEGTWRRLGSPDEIVEFYDPTDVFGDLAEALAEAYPAVAGDLDEDAPDAVSTDEETPPLT